MNSKIIITNIPAFYKIRLYNEINKQVKLLVVFTDANENDRNGDFVSGKITFDYHILKGSKFSKIRDVISILRKFNYDELIIGGWDCIIYWIAAFLSSKKKNALVLESSYFESKANGIRGVIKRQFVCRLSKVYASGISQKKITDALGFKGKTIITKGVGIFNYIKQPTYVTRNVVKKFLYVGRFVDVKNLEFLVKSFNKKQNLELYLAGFGEQEQELRKIANNNIHFLGTINNKDLPELYQRMDVFVLPSIVEPWGLVVEEALNNGLPVIVSNKVGCAEEIINESNGINFDVENTQSFDNAIDKICDIDFYNNLRKNISTMDFESIENRQISCYID